MSGAYLGLKSHGRILFYTGITLIFKYLQVNVRIRDYFRLILHPDLKPNRQRGVKILERKCYIYTI